MTSAADATDRFSEEFNNQARARLAAYKASKAVVKERDELMKQLDAQGTFIARMVREYKAELVNYIERCQNYINDYTEPSSADYWRSELAEAMRRLELSDDELMPLIKPCEPYRLVDH